MRVAVALRPNRDDELAKFARGVQAHGDTVVKWDGIDPPSNAEACVCWGWRKGGVQRLRGRNVLILERGYVGDRFLWTSAGWNGLNGRAKFAYVDDHGARWREHFAHLLKPWREGDRGYALLVGQVPTDTAVASIKLAPWLEAAARELQAFGEVCFRPHPNARSIRVAGARLLDGTLGEALAGAARTVTFNSNAGVDSILAGVPLVAFDPGSMAYELATHDVRARTARPDRTAWGHRIAWAQWLPSELAAGDAWARLRPVIFGG